MDDSGQPYFELRHLSVKLGNRLVLPGASLAARLGEIISIMGPSGCGKTTLLRAIARLQPADKGELSLGGHFYPLDGTTSKALDASFYPAVSYVPQTLALWPHLTNYDNITFSVTGSAESEVADLAKSLFISDVLDRKPDQCSQGQRQRVALIRALILAPKVLLLDEITSALDRENSRQVAKLLRNFVSRGAIVLAVTHDLRFAEEIAHRWCEMDSLGNLKRVQKGYT